MHATCLTRCSWALFAAPLLMSNDLRNMTIGAQTVLQNTEVIAVNQDAWGRQGRKIAAAANGLEVWARFLSDYTVAVILYNNNPVRALRRCVFTECTQTGAAAASITVDFESVGFAPVTQLLVRVCAAAAVLQAG